jgi:hypothetical protein
MHMDIQVRKGDGTNQLYDRGKVLKTCEKLGSTRETAEVIADKIETKLYDGIKTEKILQMIFVLLYKHKPTINLLVHLKKALSLMNPVPDFEQFVRNLMKNHGYYVTPNQIIRGKCVEHEIDAIAEKEGITYIVEVKHHVNYHTLTGLDTVRISRAVFEDITEGFELGLNDIKVDKAMVVSNTKFSGQALQYVECRGISHIGWNTPPGRDLPTMIEEKNLYPLTYLKGLDARTRRKLLSVGVIFVKDLLEKSLREFAEETRIQKKVLEKIIENAQIIFSESRQDRML